MAAALVLFATLTDWSLALTSSVSQVGLLMLARGFAAAVFFVPLGTAWGAILGRGAGPRRREPRGEARRPAAVGPRSLGGISRRPLGAVAWRGRFLVDRRRVARFCRGRCDPVVARGGVATTLARDRRICRSRRLARRRPCGSALLGRASRTAPLFDGRVHGAAGGNRDAVVAVFSMTAGYSPQRKGNAAPTRCGSITACKLSSAKMASRSEPIAADPTSVRNSRAWS